MTDFWGVAVPAWLGAVGTIGASVIAAVALIRGQSTRGGVDVLARELNRADSELTSSGTADTRDDSAGDADPLSVERETVGGPRVTDSGIVYAPAMWRLYESHRGKARLVNVTDRALTVTMISQLERGDDIHVAVPLPHEVAPMEDIPFYITRSFVSPSVIGFTLVWNDPAIPGEHSRTFFV